MGCALDFERIVGNSQVDKKEQTFGKQILAIPPKGESNKLTLLVPPCLLQ